MARKNVDPQIARDAVGGRIVSRVLKSKNVFKVKKSNRVKGQPRDKAPDYVIALKRNPKHDKQQFAKKIRGLEELGARGKLCKIPGDQIDRGGAAQAAYRKKISDRIDQITDPAHRQKLKDRFDKMDADHINELQSSGMDVEFNMWLLDSGVNRSVGSQIMNSLKHLPDGATFQIAVSRW